MHGGVRIARVLAAEGVETIFTLCGGHISPILTACESLGIRVIDTRHEATAVFAADATARLTGIPGVAAVTAGPGVTNALTALRNAKMAHSPLVLLGGATAGPLRGRGALQDIDQIELIRSHVKWHARVGRLRDLEPLLRNAFEAARDGLPGPVFLECGVDLLYDEALVREWFGKKLDREPGSLRERAVQWYLRRYLERTFADSGPLPSVVPFNSMSATERDVERAAQRLRKANRPVLLVGSQAMRAPDGNDRLRAAIERIGAPVWLSGMTRGLLGADHPLQMRHGRSTALKEADVVVLAGVPCDFRLDYGGHLRSRTDVISVNRSREELTLNRKPDLGIHADPGDFLIRVGDSTDGSSNRWNGWISELRKRDDERVSQIVSMAEQPVNGMNPIRLLEGVDAALADDSIIVADGGDFVATASYVLRPRRPLSWLDPGPFGTLGVGAGFALASSVARPNAEVWLIWGDGSSGFGLMEIDTFVRHDIPVIVVVGNDSCWTQIAREQVEILGADTACVLRSSDYHLVAEALGGRGLDLSDEEDIESTIANARAIAATRLPVVINARIGATEFRKGSISM